MKILILVRHAKSSWKYISLDDFDRPLNKRGKRDAPLMGKLLNEKKFIPDFIISSPAIRASSTAKIIAEKLNYPTNKIFWEDSLYEASANDILKVITNVDEINKTLLIVGHNPGLTNFSNYLTNDFINNIPTCGVAIISLQKKWNEISADDGKLLLTEFPKKYYKY
jgi:phosphohistidine phosphatase